MIMRPDKTKAKSKLFWKNTAIKEIKKEYFMNARELRRYHNETNTRLHRNLSLFSKYLAYRRPNPPTKEVHRSRPMKIDG
jgi:hypothetical protein